MTTQLPCRERLNQIANFHSSMALPPSHDEIEAMARALLAAYEQEPVAVIDKEGSPMTRDECNDDRVFAICCKVGTPLYTHPAPVPAVPDEMEDNGNPHDEEDMAYVGGWNACRAAMLNGGKS